MLVRNRHSLKAHPTNTTRPQHFTTKPYVDRGEVSFIGGIPTPWPCFTMVCTKDYARKNAQRLRDIITAVREVSGSDSSPHPLLGVSFSLSR